MSAGIMSSPKKNSRPAFSLSTKLVSSVMSTPRPMSFDNGGAATAVEIPAYSLDDVLANKTPEPFTKANFHVFLAGELAEENIEFYNKVSEFQMVLESSEDGAEIKAITLQTEIIQQFVIPGAPKEINISGPMRDSTLSLASESSSDLSPDVESASKLLRKDIFDAAVGEVLYLLRSGPFYRFLEDATSKNLSPVTARHRINWGIIYITLASAIVAGLCVGAHFIDDDTSALLSPWLRVIVWPLYFFGWLIVVTGMYRVCPILAMQGAYATCSCQSTPAMHLYAKKRKHCKSMLNMKDNDESVGCKFHLNHTIDNAVCDKKLVFRGMKVGFVALLLSFLFTAIAIALPPSKFYAFGR